MYTETLEFRFSEKVAPSKRLEYLARIASACEQGSSGGSGNYYFAISLERNTDCRIDIMMPSVFEIAKAQLREAHRDGILNVIKPRNFSTEEQ